MQQMQGARTHRQVQSAAKLYRDPRTTPTPKPKYHVNLRSRSPHGEQRNSKPVGVLTQVRVHPPHCAPFISTWCFQHQL